MMKQDMLLEIVHALEPLCTMRTLELLFLEITLKGHQTTKSPLATTLSYRFMFHRMFGHPRLIETPIIAVVTLYTFLMLVMMLACHNVARESSAADRTGILSSHGMS